jgi:hypothetical protein
VRKTLEVLIGATTVLLPFAKAVLESEYERKHGKSVRA